MRTIRKFQERLTNALTERSRASTSRPYCAKCHKSLVRFVQEHGEIGEFDGFDLDEKCHRNVDAKGKEWCWGQILLSVHGKESYALVYRMKEKFSAEMVDLDAFETNYGLL